MFQLIDDKLEHQLWDKGKLVGQKKPRKIRAIRVRLQMAEKIRDLALFNLAIAPGAHRNGLTVIRLVGGTYQWSVKTLTGSSLTARAPPLSRSRRRMRRSDHIRDHISADKRPADDSR